MKILITTTLFQTDVAMLAGHLRSVSVAVKVAVEAGLLCGAGHKLLDNSGESELPSLVDFELQGIYELEYRALEKNLGYGGANNLILDDCDDTDFILILNPDVIMDELAIIRSLQIMADAKNVGMITPAVVDASDGSGHVVKRFPDVLTLALRYLNVEALNVFFRSRLQNYSCQDIGRVETEVEFSGGCFFFVRGEIFKRLSGFDPRFFLYFEDFDFCLRLASIAKIMYSPKVKIFHSGGDVGRKQMRHHGYFIVSGCRFYFKHGWRFF